MEKNTLNILVCPLDWGLGHASRCIPIINKLIESGHSVTIAGSGRSLDLLKKEYPGIGSIVLDGFTPKFSKKNNLILQLFLQLPQFIFSIYRDKQNLNRLLSSQHYDCVISDNRYGLRNKRVKSILITHQVMIKTPRWLRFLEYPFYLITCKLISFFDECWIPDYKESPGLSGDLSHKYPIPDNARFIGPISRFNILKALPETQRNKIVVLISGPEPQRSIFEKILLQQLSKIEKPIIIVSGKPESEKKCIINNNITIHPHLNTIELEKLIHTASLVVCRSGYSSIMDLYTLGAKALLIPTPGQTEQIYLAALHDNLKTFRSQNQSEMYLPKDIEDAYRCREPRHSVNEDLLMPAIELLGNK